MKDVHVCPVLMRTVIWIDGECTEECGETDCPILINNHSLPDEYAKSDIN